MPLLDPVSLANAILSLETLKLEDGRFQKAVDKCIEPIRQGAWDEFLLEAFPNRLLTGETTYFKKEIRQRSTPSSARWSNTGRPGSQDLGRSDARNVGDAGPRGPGDDPTQIRRAGL